MVVDFVSNRGGGFMMTGRQEFVCRRQVSEQPDRRHPSVQMGQEPHARFSIA